MTSGEFDFFGAPASPPPAAPPAPTVNQFGMPVAPEAVNQFGLPVSAAPTRHSAPTPDPMLHRSETRRQLMLVGGGVVAVALAVVGFIAAQHQGQKTATSVSTSVLKGIVDAHAAEETADLRNAAQLEEGYLADHNTYAATTADLTAAGFVASQTSRITVVSATGTTFCLRADDTSGRSTTPLYMSGTADVSATPCS